MNARTALPLATLLLLLGACSASSDDADDPNSTGPTEQTTGIPLDADAPFRQRAMAACTDAVNSGLGTVEDPGYDVIMATRGDEGTPDAAQLQEWSEAYGERLAAQQEMRDILSAVSSEDAEEQAAWEQVIALGDPDIARSEARRDLLDAGDWATIRNDWLQTDGSDASDASSDDSGPSDGEESSGAEESTADDALDMLGLGKSDCMSPYSLAPIIEGAEEFVAEVSETCLAVGMRRDEADTKAAVKTVLDALAKTLDDEELTDDDLAELEEALVPLVEEWKSTTSDLEAVAATPPVKDGWADVLAASRERVEIFTARLEAVQSGDRAAIVEALRPSYEHPGVDFRAAGVDRQVCLNATG